MENNGNKNSRSSDKGRSRPNNRNSSNRSGRKNNRGNRRYNNRNNRGRRRRRIPLKAMSGEQIYLRYLHLLEKHKEIRQKYYDYFDRGDMNQRRKYEKQFYESIEKIRAFEESLTPVQKEYFDQKVNALPPDHEYCKVHQLGTEGDDPPPLENIDDPHLLVSQKESNFSSDTEESLGSIEDYYAYKGISPQN